ELRRRPSIPQPRPPRRAFRRRDRPAGGAMIALLVVLLAQEKAFTDVTRESGVEEGVARHWRDFPKVWLSGLTLVDLDGDGALDLHVGSHAGPKNPALMFRNDGKGKFTYVDPEISIPRGPRASDPLP